MHIKKIQLAFHDIVRFIVGYTCGVVAQPFIFIVQIYEQGKPPSYQLFWNIRHFTQNILLLTNSIILILTYHQHTTTIIHVSYASKYAIAYDQTSLLPNTTFYQAVVISQPDEKLKTEGVHLTARRMSFSVILLLLQNHAWKKQF